MQLIKVFSGHTFQICFDFIKSAWETSLCACLCSWKCVKQLFKNNPVNDEFCQAETLKLSYFAVFKNLFTGLDFTKCNKFYSGVTITAKYF